MLSGRQSIVTIALVRTLTVGERAEQLRGLSNMGEGVSRSQLQRHFPLEWHGVDSYHRVCTSDCSSLNGVNPDPADAHHNDRVTRA